MVRAGYLETDVVDTDVVYCTGNDVFTHIRNKRFVDLDGDVTDAKDKAGATSLTKKQVVDLIARFSGTADTKTKRAWRRRRVTDFEVVVKFSHTQRRARHRRRRRTAGGMGRVVTHAGHRGFADLPHNHIVDLEQVEVLNPRSVDDITDNEGREDGDYVVDMRKGVIRPNVNLFVPTGRGTARDRDIEDARLRVTYTYGHDPQPESVDDLYGDFQLSTVAPSAVVDAVALLTAARLVGSDQYGELVPQAGGDEPSLAEAVSAWKTEADAKLDNIARP